MDEWFLDEIAARTAWDLMPKIPGTNDIDWGNVVVGHINTGVSHHPVFGPWQGDASPILRIADGLNLREDGKPPFDSGLNAKLPGHGTRTASVICGNLPGAYQGVAPGVPVIPYRVVDHPMIEAPTEQHKVAQAIDAALAKGVSVISMSLGFPVVIGGNPMGAAVDRAYEQGVIVICAGGQLSDAVTFPGKYSRTIGCGGTRRDRRVWNPYDSGDTARSIDVWAPSTEMVRADVTFPTVGSWAEAPYVPAGNSATGTSYSTAQVAGAAALWLAYRANDIAARYGAAQPWKRIEAFRRLIGDQHCCTALTDPYYWYNKPKGILNARAVLDVALPDIADTDKVTRLAVDEVM